MTREELNRLAEMAQTVWKPLTDDEREAFYADIGTIGFLENVANLLHMDISTMTLDEFDELWEMVDKTEKTVTEKLNNLADELRKNVEHRLDTALLTMVETLAELDDGDVVSYSCGNIGIGLTRDCIELVDIEAGTAILSFNVEYTK